MLFHLRDAFRAGDVWLARSRRYGDIRKALLSAPAGSGQSARLARRAPVRSGRGALRRLAAAARAGAVAGGRKPPCRTGPLTWSPTSTGGCPRPGELLAHVSCPDRQDDDVVVGQSAPAGLSRAARLGAHQPDRGNTWPGADPVRHRETLTVGFSPPPANDPHPPRQRPPRQPLPRPVHALGRTCRLAPSRGA